MTEQTNDRRAALPAALSTLPGSQLLLEASAEDLRVLVCLLAGTPPTPAALAKAAGCSQARVRGALAYWQEAGIAPSAAPENTPLATGGATAPQNAGSPVSADNAGRPKKAPLLASARELAPRAESENAAYIEKHDLLPLLDACQQQMGRHFNPTEMAVIVGLSEQLGLDDTYILTLVNHCVRSGKKTLRYLEKLAIGLYDDGIDTTEALDAHFKRRERAASAEGKLRRLFGFGDRTLSPKERECFARWVVDFGYDMEIIGLAYDITVDTKQKAPVGYVDKILTRWHEAGCRDLASVEALLQREKLSRTAQRPAPRRAPAPAPIGGGSFDTDDFFAKALERSYGKEVAQKLLDPDKKT